MIPPCKPPCRQERRRLAGPRATTACWVARPAQRDVGRRRTGGGEAALLRRREGIYLSSHPPPHRWACTTISVCRRATDGIRDAAALVRLPPLPSYPTSAAALTRCFLRLCHREGVAPLCCEPPPPPSCRPHTSSCRPPFPHPHLLTRHARCWLPPRPLSVPRLGAALVCTSTLCRGGPGCRGHQRTPPPRPQHGRSGGAGRARGGHAGGRARRW